jgi:hypothetical protein
MPLDLQCKQVGCGSALVTWRPPETVGHPPLHKYKLQRSRGNDSAWESANKNLDTEDVSWVDEGLQVKKPFRPRESSARIMTGSGCLLSLSRCQFVYCKLCAKTSLHLYCRKPSRQLAADGAAREQSWKCGHGYACRYV